LHYVRDNNIHDSSNLDYWNSDYYYL